MPKLSPIKAIKLLKIFRSLGFAEIRQRGSHLILQNADGRETVVPIHQGEEIGRGLLRKILRDINLSPDQFNKLK
ncbi:addiction module toxin, HicA family [Candidatus Shapirobacteria bacterium]|nr:addiction module toxin, HicA family [Candidatus Shapirobacteria bacterium]